MNKIKFLLIISILFYSCQNNDKESLINKSNPKRIKNCLSKLDQNLKIDSTSFIESDEENWDLLNYIVTHKILKLNSEKKPNKFGIIDFYSNSSNEQFKTIYYISNDGVLKLVSEQDRFYKKINDSIEIYLNHNYNYLKNEVIYSIDSLPTEYFIKRNQKNLKEMYEYAEKNSLNICGTAASEVLSEGFPEKNTKINFLKFNRVKAELNR